MTQTARLHVPIHLRWGDLDAYNHVNNTAMLKLLEEARVRAMWRTGDGEQTYPTAVLRTGMDEGVLTLIARQEIEYLAPVPYMTEPLDVEMWFAHLGGASLQVCYEVYSPAGVTPRVLYARSAASLVLVDAETGKPTRLTPQIRAAWSPYLGEPLTFSRR